jgi:soluble lytic murein transglycosylase-like protein
MIRLAFLALPWLQAWHAVPPDIREAVVRVESRGDALAVSRSACIGLMQVCPRWSMAPRVALFVPLFNRAEGVRLLRYWHRRAHGSWRRALAGYRCGNAGLRGKCGRAYAAAVLGQ